MNQLFIYDRPVLQPQQYNVNQPPYVPNLQIASWLQPYLPYLTGVMMDLITRGAAGPVTMHFYNHMAQGHPSHMQFNPWVNEDFSREVHNCADFIHLKATQSGMQNNPGDAICRLAPAYLSLRSMYELKLYEGLWQFVDPADRQGMMQTIQQFEMEIAAILQLRNGGGAMPGIPQPIAGARTSFPAPVAAPMGSMAPQPMTGYGIPAGVSSGGKPGGGRDYSNAAPATVTPVASVTPQPMPAPVAVAPVGPVAVGPQNGQVVEMSEVPWEADFTKMPFPLAFNVVSTRMCYTIENGKTIPTPAKNEIDMLNYERHSITSLFGHVPENMPVVKDNSELMRNLTAGARDAAEEAAAVDEDDERLEEAMGLRNVITVTSLDNAIQDVQMEMLSKIDRGHPPMVFQAYAEIYTPIIGAELEYDTLRRFADSASYAELREKLRTAGGTASPVLVTEAIMRVTELMNHILQRRLSILPTEVLVDDFVQDFDQLVEILKEDYGDRVYRAFLTDQALRIKELFGMPDLASEQGQALHAALTEGALTKGWEDRPEEERPKVTFFGPTVRLSFLNIISHDLWLGGLSKIGNVLTRQQTPALYELADKVFKADDQGLMVARQLVVLKDGRIIELTKAYLVPDSYLVTLVK